MYEESQDNIRDEIELILKEKLLDFDIGDFENINEKMFQYLFEIESTIQLFLKKRKEILDEYKKYRINQKSICENGQVNFTRQTINNNKNILAYYIEKRKFEIDEQDKDIFSQLNYYKKRNSILEGSLKKIQNEIFISYNNSLEIEKLNIKIKKLENKLKMKINIDLK